MSSRTSLTNHLKINCFYTNTIELHSGILVRCWGEGADVQRQLHSEQKNTPINRWGVLVGLGVYSYFISPHLFSLASFHPSTTKTLYNYNLPLTHLSLLMYLLVALVWEPLREVFCLAGKSSTQIQRFIFSFSQYFANVRTMFFAQNMLSLHTKFSPPRTVKQSNQAMVHHRHDYMMLPHCSD